MEAGKRNPWLTHVKKTLKAHKGKSFKAVLKMAKKTYKGGADVEPASGDAGTTMNKAAPVGGRRRSRKGSKKTRRTRKH
jgi:hypothetical protein